MCHYETFMNWLMIGNNDHATSGLWQIVLAIALLTIVVSFSIAALQGKL
jgi:hypothetical protein